MIKTLDERIRERGQQAWKAQVIEVFRRVNEVADGPMRKEKMQLATTEQDGKQVVSIGCCIDRLMEAVINAGMLRAGEGAIAQFLRRHDKLLEELETLHE